MIAAVSLIAFIVIQLSRKTPLLNLRLLVRRNFGLGTLANFFFGFSMYGWIYVVPLYLARMQGYNAQQIGEVLIWIGLPQLAIIPLMPKLMRRVDPRLLVTDRIRPVHRRQPPGHEPVRRLLRPAVHRRPAWCGRWRSRW